MFRLIALLLLILAPVQALAQSALFTSDVSIDITGSDAADARNQAMKQAERDGLANLLDRLAPAQRPALMTSLDEKAISGMARGVEVVEEKIAGSRYRASLRVSFDAISVNGLLDKHVEAANIPEIADKSTSVMVLPLFEAEDGRLLLWGPDNAWLAAWKGVGVEQSGGHIVVPYGDSVDAASIAASSVPSATFNALAPFINRYGISEIAVVKATYFREPQPHVEVVKRQVSRYRNDVIKLDYQADPQEDRDALLKRAARESADQIERQRQETIARRDMTGNASGQQLMVIPLSTMSSWTTVRQQLLSLPAISRLEVLAISPEQVDVQASFRGAEQGLSASIQALGLRLEQSGTFWIVSRE